jgi:hypothetical protein
VEFGFLLYFLFVFVFGGFVLIGLVAYVSWAVAIRRDRPAWRDRTRRSQVAVAVSIFLIACLLFIPLRVIWVTRVDAIPGTYTADGVWGSSTLEIRRDGTFVETWRFKNEYNDKPEGQGSAKGSWRDEGRDWLTRDVSLDPFKPLAGNSRDNLSGSVRANVMGYGFVTLIEVDPGANIVFQK